MSARAADRPAAMSFALRLSAAAPWTLATLFAVIFFVLIALDALHFRYENALATHVLFGVLFVSYGVFLALRRKLPGPTPLDLPLAVVVVIVAASVMASPYTTISLQAILPVAAVMAVLYFIEDVKALKVEALVGIILAVAVFLAVAVIVWSVAQYIADLELKRALFGSLNAGDYVPAWRRPGVFYHPNNLASVMNIALPFALALALHAKSPLGKAGAAGALATCFVVLVLTNSRGAWIALIVALPVFFYLKGATDGRIRLRLAGEWLRRHRRKVAVTLAAAVLLGSLAAALAFAMQPEWLFRDSASPRLYTIGVALDMIADRPLLGFGPRTFGLFYTSYGGESVVISHPDNQYLDIALGSGLVGLAGAGFFALLVFRLLLRGTSHVDARQRALAAACAAAFVTLLVHGLTDTPLLRAGVLLPAALVLVIAVRLDPRPLEPRSLSRLLSRVVIVALVPLCLLTWLSSDRSHSHYDLSLDLLEQGRLEEAIRQAELAASDDPDFVAYPLHAGVLNVLLYNEQRDAGAEADEQTLERGIHYLRRAVELDPRGFLAYANLAEALRLQDKPDQAAAAARMALALTPSDYTYDDAEARDPSIAIASATILEWAGHLDEAAEAYAVALHFDPTISQSPFWSRSPQREALRREAIELSGISPCLHGRNAALYGSYGDDLRELTAECRASTEGSADQAALAIMLQAQGLHEEAIQVATAAARSSDTPAMRTALGYVLAGDDMERARRELFAGDRDGLPLLALTYDIALESDVALHPDWPTPAEPPPMELLRRVGNAERDEPSLLPLYYYIARLRREPPEVPLLPGEWLSLRSPRTLLLDAIAAEFD